MAGPPANSKLGTLLIRLQMAGFVSAKKSAPGGRYALSADRCKRTTAKKFDQSARQAVLDSQRFVSTLGYKLTKRILLVPRVSSQPAHIM